MYKLKVLKVNTIHTKLLVNKARADVRIRIGRIIVAIPIEQTSIGRIIPITADIKVLCVINPETWKLLSVAYVNININVLY